MTTSQRPADGEAAAEAPAEPDAPRPSRLREALRRDRIMAIVRYRGGGDVSGAIDGLARGGVRVLEVTVDTPGAWDAIERAAARPELVVGAGTVTEVDQVERLAALGGEFVVSPGFDPDVVAAALERGLEPLPGVATGTEVLAARRAGAEFFKLFPAGSLGVRYLTELRGPFGKESFVPTGGISLAHLWDWLAAGAFAVAFGSELAGRAAPGTEEEIESIAGRVRAALSVVGIVS
ncbi:MAG TPA: bifunctional 4-hydroxy-2-oxoglutarate aldolase/2-dehydro-3-deoxy-phosphogluconate aldolase [Actinocrinis sp.]|jgi:2-dehydro-3-deoxyphosphogluconate aldolase/(4S)-4-hydroxy-2-oxoglutarate aldolase|uniref:bifunctional 4-hydroxy-2-oxoglutarate aldolase/2-dehydro-3-deoxy-phosphogluconate aldolase n=1 Tax=Actinocrinis sp. TaxID=1920516 RepID=UPI002DDDBABE|nr:bifunctional 4-hydroxy-2-oxoglutarate aldolase/2-dehydro-3-deoxy-phosphogluconate aldolase [Actinocrinis sp.]HEV3173865.1 bifunctional 4-hydroxy-2-oxoglutarate aldolase/2-dehydro-3-deoxy-phosphogluconate aldolase [Actinocrinis sp.]